MKVVWLAGLFTPDARHWDILAQRVDLTVYASRFLYPGAYYSPEPPPGCASRTFSPLVPTTRGHQLWLYRGLSAALHEDRPDLVHVVSEAWGTLTTQAANWVRKNGSASLVIHGCDRIWWHGSPPEIVAKRLLSRRNLRRADAFTGETSRTVELARSAGLRADAPTASIHTHPRDSGLFRPPEDERERRAARETLGLPLQGPGVGFLGRLYPEKGPLQFLDALERAGSRLEGAWAAIGGAGALEDEVAARARSLGVSFLGPLRFPDQVTAFYKAVDVFVAPSVCSSEVEDQSPRSVIEAMLSECIVVGSDCGAIPEMIQGVGVVTKQRDVDDLAHGMAMAVQRCSDRSMRRAARTGAIDRYSSKSVADQLLLLWDSALQRRRDLV